MNPKDFKPGKMYYFKSYKGELASVWQYDGSVVVLIYSGYGNPLGRIEEPHTLNGTTWYEADSLEEIKAKFL